MTRILVSGYYGFGNAGDEAILAGMIAALRADSPDVRFTVVSGKAARTRDLHGVEALSRNRPGPIWAAAGAADLVISGGGSLLQDVTGMRSIPYYLSVVAMARLRRRPAMFYAQGIGPVQRPLSRALVRLVGNRVQCVTVRDAESAAALRDLGVRRPPVTVTADAALSLPPGDRGAGRRLLADLGVPVGGAPLLGVCVRPWGTRPAGGAGGAGGHLAALAGALDRLQIGDSAVQPVLIPMQWPHDVAAGRLMAERMNTPPAVIDAPLDYRQALDAIAGCDAVLGMRYHALVFAAMCGVPLAGISYDPKNDNFLRRLGLAAVGQTHDLSADAVVAGVRGALGQTPAQQQRVRTAMAELAALSRENARLALELVGRRAHDVGP